MLAVAVLHVLAFTGWQTARCSGAWRCSTAGESVCRPRSGRSVTVDGRPSHLCRSRPRSGAEDRRQFSRPTRVRSPARNRRTRVYSANSTVAANPENPSGKWATRRFLNGKENAAGRARKMSGANHRARQRFFGSATGHSATTPPAAPQPVTPNRSRQSRRSRSRNWRQPA